jgi:vancomycin permeability regulator SanA
MFSLDNIKRRQQNVKKYFNKSVKTVKFKVIEKVLLWDSTHANRGRHSKFQKLWLVPFNIALVLGTNLYILKYLQERLFSYSTNDSHLKHYVEPT